MPEYEYPIGDMASEEDDGDVSYAILAIAERLERLVQAIESGHKESLDKLTAIAKNVNRVR